jgi:DNA-binding NtrC family response regulator
MIKVTSEPGCGATFKLYFPAITGGVNKPNGVSEGDVSLPRGIERILVIDDEDAIVDMEQAVLETLGYTVISKTSSMEALEEFRRTPEEFDLIITDQTMPFLTGVELAKEAMVIKPTVPVILCTGYSSVVTEEEALEIGIKSFAKKPVDVKSFAMMVRNVLDDR